MPDSDRLAYFVSSQGYDIQAATTGLAWLVQTLEAGHPAGCIVVPTREHLTRGHVLCDLLGRKACRGFSASAPMMGPGKKPIYTYTHRTLLRFRAAPVVLAVHPTRDTLDRIDDLPGVKAVAVIPWATEEMRYWVQAWRAQALRATSCRASQAPLPAGEGGALGPHRLREPRHLGRSPRGPVPGDRGAAHPP